MPDKSIEALLNKSLSFHHAGRMGEARSNYKKILKKIPMHVEALHFLGLTYIQTKEHLKGIKSIQRALVIKPSYAEAHYNLGNAFCELGQLDNAAEAYERALSVKPDYWNVYTNLGNVLNQQKKSEQAIECYQRTLSIKPGQANAYNGLGVALGELKRFDEAIVAYQQALSCSADFADAHNNLGYIFFELKQFDAAISAFKKALFINPALLAAYVGLANTLYIQEQYDGAIQFYRDALAIKPDVECAYKLASLFNKLKRFHEAIPYYELALSITPKFADAHNGLGVALSETLRIEEAIVSYRKVLSIDPDYCDALNNLGNALFDIKQYDEAIICYKQALSIDPDYADAYNGLGNTQVELNHFSDAITLFQRALAIRPGYARVIYNLGAALANLKRYEEALEKYRIAIEIEPECTEARWNFSLVSLLLGQFQIGWQEYEQRWQLKATTYIPDSTYPCWLGEYDISGKQLFIQIEQGLGDAIQMMRYVTMIEQQGVRCWIQVPPPLLQLIQRSFPNARVVDKEISPEGLDYRVPIMSLPLSMRTFMEADIPQMVPYLVADEARMNNWASVLASPFSKTVGLVWRGNPTHKNDRNRSIALAEYIPLILAHPSIQFFTLQKDLTAQELDQLKPHSNVSILDKELTDFDETAAVMSNLDLIITVDSAPAHLAGALGKPTWILLCFAGEWRWLHERKDSPWYPSATLFRQSNIGNWAEVITEVNHELAKLGEVVNEQV